MNSEQSRAERRFFASEANAIECWLRSEGFEPTEVDTRVAEWGRIHFDVDFSGGEPGQKHARWCEAFLTGHDHVVVCQGDWSVSVFVLLDELGCDLPEGVCRYVGCTDESDQYVVRPAEGVTTRYCGFHAMIASDDRQVPDSPEQLRAETRGGC